MRTINPVGQIRELRLTLVKLYLPVLAALAGAVALRLAFGIDTSLLTRDPDQIAMVNPLYGILSNIGVLIWCTTAAIGVFCAAALRRRHGERRRVRFVLTLSLLTALLTIDDFFMLHDVVLPKYLDVPGVVMYMLYAVSMTLILTVFRREILNSEYVLLLLALTFFAGSVGIDVATDAVPAWEHLAGSFLVEDGLKLFGIVTWSAYLTRLCLQTMRRLLTLREPPVAPWASPNEAERVSGLRRSA